MGTRATMLYGDEPKGSLQDTGRGKVEKRKKQIERNSCKPTLTFKVQQVGFEVKIGFAWVRVRYKQEHETFGS
jgi:hypothetical protein